MLSYKILWPVNQIKIFDTETRNIRDTYDIDMMYIGSGAPVYRFSNSLYSKIINEIMSHKDDDEYTADDIDIDIIEAEPTPIIECDSKFTYRSGFDKPLINLVHWWFIDRNRCEFNEVEKYHIDKLIQYSIPKCDSIYINVCFDSAKDEYKKLILEYFAKYDNVHITFDTNERMFCEYKTFKRIYEFKNCYVLYSHFKGMGCMANPEKKSSFCSRSLDDEYWELYYLYEYTFNVTLEDIQDKLFYGHAMVKTYTDNVNYIDGYSSKKFYSGVFYCINMDNLYQEMNRVGMSRDIGTEFHVYGELLPSMFPIEMVKCNILND